MRERFLPECSVTGRDRRKLQFAVLAAAAQHGGVDVDLLDEVTWWQTDDFWRYAAHAAVAYIRMAADQAGVPEAEVCHGIRPETIHDTLLTCSCAPHRKPSWPFGAARRPESVYSRESS